MYHRLKDVSRLLGGTPTARTLRDWCRVGLITHSGLPSGKVYLLSDEQIARLRDEFEGGEHVEAEPQSRYRLA